MWWIVAAVANANVVAVVYEPVRREPLVRRFVTDRDVAHSLLVPHVVVPGLPERVHVTLLPDGHRMETVLRLAGAQRLPGREWRIAGAEPLFYIDGVAMDSNLR